jgi:RNA polymerase sigma-70 factor, ECF subfamily
MSRSPADPVEEAVRAHWWGAVATVTRLSGDVAIAEDAVQEACTAALRQWRSDVPVNPGGWLIGVARRKAIDALRREAARGNKEEAAAARLIEDRYRPPDGEPDDDLRLIFLCCHPALDASAQVALTLRVVCGLAPAEIAAALLVPESTLARRLTRAKNKIRDAAIPFRMPTSEEMAVRLPAVLKVIYLVFTEGHMATRGDTLVRSELCDTAVYLARTLADRLPDEPEVSGLLALLLFTDARRPARTDEQGDLVLLEEQDRSLWDGELISEAVGILERSLRHGRPGPYQLQAAIAACHGRAATAADTDWRQIALLYAELLHYEPTPVFEANRAIAVAMSEGPAAGLVILDAVGHHPQLARWPPLHVARADLLGRLGRSDEAADAYRLALQLEPAGAQRRFIEKRLDELASAGP